MANQILMPMRSLLVNGSHRFATCWLITRADGETLSLTDHDQSLVVDSVTYEPMGSLSASARQFREGMEPQNFEVRGIITSDKITEDDLRAGKYRNAEVLEFIVDWHVPWAGTFYQHRYFVQSTTHERNTWKGEMAGLLMALTENVGDLDQLGCTYDLGDADCTIDIGALTVSGTVSSVIGNKYKFSSTVTGVDGFYTDALLTWTSGSNDGFKFDVKKFTSTSGVIELQLPTAYSITPGDTFTIYRGCKKTTADCKTFNNLINYGGEPFLPGNDDLFTFPDAKEQ